MNAYVLYKLHDQANYKKLPPDYSSLEFICDWLDEVISAAADDIAPSSDSNDDVPVLQYKQHRYKWWKGDVGTSLRLNTRVYHSLEHAGNVYMKNIVGEEGSQRLDLRRECMCCGERTVYFCSVCNVPLCIGNCCKVFHTSAKLPRKKT